mmetsp:Transcript_17052/g.31023  ORF Transcript_17052/g.31023 Transcript_17052/m.31023 type:complete len:302 (-) Transcript_17052:682-1587(-)
MSSFALSISSRLTAASLSSLSFSAAAVAVMRRVSAESQTLLAEAQIAAASYMVLTTASFAVWGYPFNGVPSSSSSSSSSILALTKRSMRHWAFFESLAAASAAASAATGLSAGRQMIMRPLRAAPPPPPPAGSRSIMSSAHTPALSLLSSYRLDDATLWPSVSDSEDTGGGGKGGGGGRGMPGTGRDGMHSNVSSTPPTTTTGGGGGGGGDSYEAFSPWKELSGSSEPLSVRSCWACVKSTCRTMNACRTTDGLSVSGSGGGGGGGEGGGGREGRRGRRGRRRRRSTCLKIGSRKGSKGEG